MVRNGKRPLTQIINRMEENFRIQPLVTKTTSNLFIAIKPPNNVYQIKDYFVIIIDKTECRDNYICKVYTKLKSLFVYENFDSKNMGCYLSEEDDFYFTYICVDKLIKPSMCIYNIDCYFKKLIFMTLFHNIL